MRISPCPPEGLFRIESTDAPVLRGKPAGLLCIDLDDTLIRNGAPVDTDVLTKMESLGRSNWIRIIATGRSPDSLRRIIPDPSRFPADFIVFSSGAGIIDCSSDRIVRAVNHMPFAITPILSVLNARRLDYMIHDPAPQNTPFAWFSHTADNTDFRNRIRLYSSVATALPGPPSRWERASAQIIAIVPAANPTVTHAALTDALPDYHVIRTTSPLDGRSIWFEINPAVVSKSQACQWLRNRLGDRGVRTIAVGNDTNDLDLLQWADEPWIVKHASPELAGRFPVIESDGVHPVSALISTLIHKESR